VRVFRDLSFTALALTIGLGHGSAQKRPEGPPPGQMVDIGGRSLQLRCVGPADASPVVILEAGGGAFSSAWTAVQDALADRVRTCAYDRAGSGWSDRGPAPRTLTQETFELGLLLDAAKLRGPYVLVGQSLGGLIVRLYAHQSASRVAGMVLVDPTHESGILGSVRYGGLVRLREKATGRGVPEPKRDGDPNAAADPEADYLAEELARIHRLRQADPRPLGSKPLIVLAAGKRPAAPPGTSADAWTAIRDERDEQLRGLTGLSADARFTIDPASGHNIQADNPPLVAGAIGEVVEAVRTGRPLAR
jgi:pimeloyl-ACP methyl ester carboxylesterase